MKNKPNLQTKFMFWVLALVMLIGGLQILLFRQMTIVNLPKSLEIGLVQPTMQSQDLQEVPEPVDISNQTIDIGEIEKIVEGQMRIISFISLLFLLAAGLIGSTLLSRHISKPLNRLSGQIATINAQSLNTRLVTEGSDGEIQRMTEEINMTLDRLERSFSSQEQFVLDAAHELRTPVSTLLVQNEYLLNKKDLDEGNAKLILGNQKKQLSRMEALVEDLLVLAKNEEDFPGETFNLQELIGEICIDLNWLAKKQKVNLIYEPKESYFIFANPSLIDRLIKNILINAIQYNIEDGEVLVELTSDLDSVILTIQDTGIGIPSSDLPFIFDRFYRGDQSRSRLTGGTGLGLAIVKHIADSSNAQVDVRSELGKGTCFTVKFPNSMQK